MEYLGAKDATTTENGKIKLASALGGTADSPTIEARSAFVVLRSVDTASIPASTFTKVDWDTVEYDLNSDFSLANDRFTAPFDGVYLFTSQVETAAANKRYFLMLYKNGTEFKRGGDMDTTVTQGQMVSALVQLTAGDYVEVYMWHDVAGVIDGTANGEFCSFSGSLIART